MRIRVKLFSWFREYLPAKAKGEATVELPEGATVTHLLVHLGIAVHIESIVVNDQPEPDRERTLCDDDRVSIFPLVFGG
jgi:sulfur carrier protein ThiS